MKNLPGAMKSTRYLVQGPPMPSIFLVEFSVFFLLVYFYGFSVVFLAYWAPTFLGFFVLSMLRRQLQSAVKNPAEFQAKMSQSFESGSLFSKSTATFAFLVSGLLFVIPMLTTRIVALLLFLPPTRKLIVFFGKTWLANKITKGQFKVFGAGSAAGFGFSSTNFNFGPDSETIAVSELKDVTPTAPAEITSKKT